MRAFISFVALALAACAAPPPPDVNPLAEAYVHMALEVGAHEEGFIDSYTGPEEWKTEADANPRSIADLKVEADRIATDLAAIDTSQMEAIEARRVASLLAHVQSARFRLDMIDGALAPFSEEAEHLYAVRPEIKPLADYDAALAELERAVPGTGPIDARVEAFRARYVIPDNRLDAVMRAAIAECRRRTLEHIDLPEAERFTLEFVTNQPWSGYNWYQGDFHSLIQVNTDQPILIDRAVDLGCHEGYPGHHTLQTLLDQRLAQGRGWIEYTVFPLYSPIALLAEGSGNAGVMVAFPGEEEERYVTETLFPLAGLDPATAPAYYAYARARDGLEGVGVTLAQMYLDGEIDRDQVIALKQRYELRSRDNAEQSLAFIDQYRSYVLNYSLGEQMVRAYVERAGADQAARWAAFERILTEPMLPSDLEASP